VSERREKVKSSERSKKVLRHGGMRQVRDLVCAVSDAILQMQQVQVREGSEGGDAFAAVLRNDPDTWLFKSQKIMQSLTTKRLL